MPIQFTPEENPFDDPVFARISFCSSEVSQEVTTIARKNMQVVLRKLQVIGQVNVAKQLGVDESNVSRYKSSDLERAMLFLAALGVELPGEDKQLYEKSVVEAMRVLAVANLEGIKKPEVSGNWSSGQTFNL